MSPPCDARWTTRQAPPFIEDHQQEKPALREPQSLPRHWLRGATLICTYPHTFPTDVMLTETAKAHITGRADVSGKLLGSLFIGLMMSCKGFCCYYYPLPNLNFSESSAACII